MKSEVFKLLSSEVVVASSLVVFGCLKTHQSCCISFLIVFDGAKFPYCLEEQYAVVHALIITMFTNIDGFLQNSTPNHHGDNLNIHFMDLREWMNKMAKHIGGKEKYG